MRYLRLGKVNFDILIPIVLIISYMFGFSGQFFMAYMTVFIHETAHTVVAMLLGCDVEKIYLLSYGTRVDLKIELDSRAGKFAVFAAGPVINFLIALFIMLSNVEAGLKEFITATNLCLGVFNLLPLLPLDGGEILSVFTSSRYGLFRSQKINGIFFGIVISLLLLLSIPLALYENNFSIMILSLFLLFNNRNHVDAAYTNAKNLYLRRARLLKKGFYGVREIAVLERLTLGEAFKLMDFDQYHILIVMDESMKIVDRFTESELLSAINTYGYGFTFGELHRRLN